MHRLAFPLVCRLLRAAGSQRLRVVRPMSTPRCWYTPLPIDHGRGTGRWVSCAGCSGAYSESKFKRRHIAECPALRRFRRLRGVPEPRTQRGGDATDSSAGCAPGSAAARAGGSSDSGGGRGGASAWGSGEGGGWSAGAAPCSSGGGAGEAAAGASVGRAASAAPDALGDAAFGGGAVAGSGRVDVDGAPVAAERSGPGAAQGGLFHVAAGMDGEEAVALSGGRHQADEPQQGAEGGLGGGWEERLLEEHLREAEQQEVQQPDELLWEELQEDLARELGQELQDELGEESADEAEADGAEGAFGAGAQRRGATYELKRRLDQPLYEGAPAHVTLRW